MAKRFYVNANKEIERLMYEKVNWKVEGDKMIVVDSENSETSNAPVRGGISTWESSFRTSKIFDKRFRNFSVSKFCGKAESILRNILVENLLKKFHLIKDFGVILAFIKNNGIEFFFSSLNMQGHISESIKIARLGFQCLINFFVK